jgi:hypothetical protein
LEVLPDFGGMLLKPDFVPMNVPSGPIYGPTDTTSPSTGSSVVGPLAENYSRPVEKVQLVEKVQIEEKVPLEEKVPIEEKVRIEEKVQPRQMSSIVYGGSNIQLTSINIDPKKLPEASGWADPFFPVAPPGSPFANPFKYLTKIDNKFIYIDTNSDMYMSDSIDFKNSTQILSNDSNSTKLKPTSISKDSENYILITEEYVYKSSTISSPVNWGKPVATSQPLSSIYSLIYVPSMSKYLMCLNGSIYAVDTLESINTINVSTTNYLPDFVSGSVLNRPLYISLLSDGSFAAVTLGGEAYYSNNLKSWAKIPLPDIIGQFMFIFS